MKDIWSSRPIEPSSGTGVSLLWQTPVHEVCPGCLKCLQRFQFLSGLFSRYPPRTIIYQSVPSSQKSLDFEVQS